jgi:hypothetical protein
MFSNFNDFHISRQAAAEWRRVELLLEAVNLFEWEEDLVRNVLRIGPLDDDTERRLYAAYLDRYNFHQQQSFVVVGHLQQPFVDPDETETEDEEEPEQFAVTASPTPAPAPAPTPALTPALTPTSAPIPASRKRGRRDDEAPPEPVAKQMRSATRSSASRVTSSATRMVRR